MIRFSPTGPLTTGADCLAVPVDCAGALDRGPARAAAAAFPAILGPYARSCARGALRPGLVQFVRTGAPEAPAFVALVALTERPGEACETARLADALGKLPDGMRRGGMRSIALPPLGAGAGGLTWPEVRETMIAVFAGAPDLEVVIHGPEPEGWVAAAESAAEAAADPGPWPEPALCEAGPPPEAYALAGAAAAPPDPRTPEEAFEAAYGAPVPGLRAPEGGAPETLRVPDGGHLDPDPPPPPADWADQAAFDAPEPEPPPDGPPWPDAPPAVRRVAFDPALEGILAAGAVADLRAAVERGLAAAAALGLPSAPYDGLMNAGYRWEPGGAAPRAVVEVHARALIPARHQRWEAADLSAAAEAARADIEAWTAEIARQAA